MSDIKVVKTWDELPPVVFENCSLRSQVFSTRVLEKQYRELESKVAELEAEKENNPAVAAIQYALQTDDGLMFLRLWNEGEFDAVREEWPDCPDECFIGAEVGR